MFLHLSVPGQVSPLGKVHPPGQVPSRAGTPWAGTPPWQCMLGYGQQAGGTNPTKMHSCSFSFFTQALKMEILYL